MLFSDSIDVLKFNRFAIAMAARAAQMLNYPALAEDADIDAITEKAMANFLL